MSSRKDQAIARLCDIHYNQSLWLPETPSHPKLRVTYGTTRNFDDASLPVVLFVGAMFGCRWHAIWLEQLAQDIGIRVITTDRPGMGGSTPVDLKIRIQVWLETVPVLLEKLHVKHVALVTHSAGTIYMLNTLHHLRHILHPTEPYAAFIAPWVATTSSAAALLSLAAGLPSKWINGWSGISRFFATVVAPSTQWSGGIVSKLADLLNPAADERTASSPPDLEPYGVDDETAQWISKLYVKFFFAEDNSAGSQEALLCLRKGGPESWGVCWDYAEFVRNFVLREREWRAVRPDEEKLLVKAFFASSDIMIGKGGQAYFDECWAQDGVSDVIDFESALVPSSSHESVAVDYKHGVLEGIFEEVKQLGQAG